MKSSEIWEESMQKKIYRIEGDLNFLAGFLSGMKADKTEEIKKINDFLEFLKELEGIEEDNKNIL